MKILYIKITSKNNKKTNYNSRTRDIKSNKNSQNFESYIHDYNFKFIISIMKNLQSFMPLKYPNHSKSKLQPLISSHNVYGLGIHILKIDSSQLKPIKNNS